MSYELTQKDLKKAFYLMQKLSNIYPKMSLNLARITVFLFWNFFNTKELEQSIVEDSLDINKSTLSKGLRFLSKYTHDRKDGLDLIRIDRDPMNLKNNLITLTEKGEIFKKYLLSDYENKSYTKKLFNQIMSK